jgi:hypothetical protein
LRATKAKGRHDGGLFFGDIQKQQTSLNTVCTPLSKTNLSAAQGDEFEPNPQFHELRT